MTVEEIVDSLKRLDGRFDGLESRFDGLRNFVGEKYAELRYDIDSVRSEMIQRFGDLEGRMMRRFDEVNVRLSRADALWLGHQ